MMMRSQRTELGRASDFLHGWDDKWIVRAEYDPSSLVATRARTGAPMAATPRSRRWSRGSVTW